jgi:hypothetical protein
MDYSMPRASALPPFKSEIVEVLSPTNPFGIKAGGEGGTHAGDGGEGVAGDSRGEVGRAAVRRHPRA